MKTNLYDITGQQLEFNEVLESLNITSLNRLAQPEESKRATDGLYAKSISAFKDKGFAH